MESNGNVDADLDFANKELHELSQDLHVLIQDLADMEKQLRFLKESYEEFFGVLPLAGKACEQSSDKEMRRMGNSLRYLERRLEHLVGWVGNYRDRTNIQINLVSSARLFG